jgi:hypothetical protein
MDFTEKRHKSIRRTIGKRKGIGGGEGKQGRE